MLGDSFSADIATLRTNRTVKFWTNTFEALGPDVLHPLLLENGRINAGTQQNIILAHSLLSKTRFDLLRDALRMSSWEQSQIIKFKLWESRWVAHSTVHDNVVKNLTTVSGIVAAFDFRGTFNNLHGLSQTLCAALSKAVRERQFLKKRVGDDFGYYDFVNSLNKTIGWHIKSVLLNKIHGWLFRNADIFFNIGLPMNAKLRTAGTDGLERLL